VTRAQWSRICRTPSRPRRAVIAVVCVRASANAANSARQINGLRKRGKNRSGMILRFPEGREYADLKDLVLKLLEEVAELRPFQGSQNFAFA
jgi:hypothetical protein